jgi:hypothetical protein
MVGMEISKIMNKEFSLTKKERIEVALTLGWLEVDGIGHNLIGYRPMRYKNGEIHGYLDQEHVPDWDTDVLFMVRKMKKLEKNNE